MAILIKPVLLIVGGILGWEWFKGDGEEPSALRESKWWLFAVAAVVVGWFWFKKRGRA